MADPRTAFCLFCDDVRMEMGNKPSLMGIYTGEMIFPEEPPPGHAVAVQKLVVIWWLFCSVGDNPEWIKVHLYGPPGRSEFAKIEIPADQIVAPRMTYEDTQRLYYSAMIPIFNFTLPSEGVVEVAIETEQGFVRAGRLRVRVPGRPELAVDVAPISATASPQPSEQSPPVAPVTTRKRAPRRPSSRRTARTPALE